MPPRRSSAKRFAGGTALTFGVIITDTLGWAWRIGQTDIAIGAAGVVMEDLRGSRDACGRPLGVTQPVVADEIAGFADLVKRK